MKNMKIKVENNLDEIVATLESKWYKKLSATKSNPSYVIVTPDGYYSIRKAVAICNTTLAELKEM